MHIVTNPIAVRNFTSSTNDRAPIMVSLWDRGTRMGTCDVLVCMCEPCTLFAASQLIVVDTACVTTGATLPCPYLLLSPHLCTAGCRLLPTNHSVEQVSAVAVAVPIMCRACQLVFATAVLVPMCVASSSLRNKTLAPFLTVCSTPIGCSCVFIGATTRTQTRRKMTWRWVATSMIVVAKQLASVRLN